MKRSAVVAVALTAFVLSFSFAAKAGPRAAARAAAADGAFGVEMWQARHPEAAAELGVWVRTHPDAAAKFFDWDATHTERSREFAWWAIGNPGMGIEGFAALHPRWAEFNFIMTTHRPAANEFMGWCRRHPEAAQELMNHPRGLYWAGYHLYQDAWHMEHPWVP